MAAKRVVYVTKDGLQISWVLEIDDGIELALEQRHECEGCAVQEIGMGFVRATYSHAEMMRASSTSWL